MNNCNAEFTGGINIGNTYFFAVNLNMAFIRLVDAAHHLMTVDLPAPFSPRSTWTLPGSTLTETLFTTLVLPNILETPTRDSCVIFSRFPYGCGNVTAPRCTYSLGLLKQAQAACIDVVDQNRRLAPAISCVSCPSSDRLDRSSLNIDCLHSPGSRVTSLNHVKEGFRA